MNIGSNKADFLEDVPGVLKGSLSIIFPTNGNRIGVKFPYDKNVIALLKSINGHRWHPEEKRWSVPWSVENAHRILSTRTGGLQ